MQTAKIPVTAIYNEAVLPKGCRKKRMRTNWFMYAVEIPSYSGLEAPVALREGVDDEIVETRYADGDFYQRSAWAFKPHNGFYYDPRFHVTFPREKENLPKVRGVTKDLPFAEVFGNRLSRTKSETKKEIGREIAGMVLIDGQVWERCPEPRLSYSDFGRAGIRSNWWGNEYSILENNNPNIEILLPDAFKTPDSATKNRLMTLGRVFNKLSSAYEKCGGFRDIEDEVVICLDQIEFKLEEEYLSAYEKMHDADRKKLGDEEFDRRFQEELERFLISVV